MSVIITVITNKSLNKKYCIENYFLKHYLNKKEESEFAINIALFL